MLRRNTPLRDLSVLLTGITLLVVLGQLITSAPNMGWVVASMFGVFSLLGWTLYWKLPLRG